jgi:hypothetical protein
MATWKRFSGIYTNTFLLYGFTRAVTLDYDGKMRYFNGNTHMHEIKDILFTDQAGRIALNTIAALCVWPIMLASDFSRLECVLRGKDPNEFQKPR